MSDDLFYQKTTSITRDEHSPRQHAPWKLGVTTPLGERSASTAVEYLTQGELIALWQQIGVALNLMQMRDDLTPDQVERMGVHLGK